MYQPEMNLCHKHKGTSLCAFSSRKIITTIGIVCVVVAPVCRAETLVSSTENVITESAAIEFNPSFMHGAAVDVSRFDRGNFVSPGDYPVTVIVNNQNRGKRTVHFTSPDNRSSAHACFTYAELEQLGIKLTNAPLQRGKLNRILSGMAACSARG